jgi:hypothetical protein
MGAMLRQSSLCENAHWAFSVAAELRVVPMPRAGLLFILLKLLNGLRSFFFAPGFFCAWLFVPFGFVLRWSIFKALEG